MLWERERMFFYKPHDFPIIEPTERIGESVVDVVDHDVGGDEVFAVESEVGSPEEAEIVGEGESEHDAIPIIMEVTAYNATVEQCGKDDGITASGTTVTEGRTVACNDFPFGTKLLIGGNVYVVEDRCGYDGVVDIYFDGYDDAMSWGRRTMEIIVVESS